MVDGGGGRPFWGGSILELSHSQLWSTRTFPNGNRMATRPAHGWTSLPKSHVPPLEFQIEYVAQSGKIPEEMRFDREPVRSSEPVTLHGLLYGRRAPAYDTVALYPKKNRRNAWCILGKGEWSKTILHDFTFFGRKFGGSLRIVLEDLDAETGGLSLYFSQVYPVDHFTQPAGLGPDLVEKFGAYVNHPAFSAFSMGWFPNGPETFLRMMEYQNEWLAHAARHLMERSDWDLFAVQLHCIDFANHAFVPRGSWSDEETRENLRHLARCYESVDRAVGEIVAAAGDDALVCIVSDHGATETPSPEVFINPILHDAGLLAYEEEISAAVRPRIDPSKTAAQQQRAGFIYINLRGREPAGIVAPDHYEAVRDECINALRAYREPTTGRNPFSMILRKEDARILGLFDSLGRDVGDIVYALLPQFDHEHGRQLPTATLGGQTVKPLMIFAGPGIKADTVIQRNAWLVDVAPTISHCMGWPVPSEADGAVLYQLLDGHVSNFPRPDFMTAQEDSPANGASSAHNSLHQ